MFYRLVLSFPPVPSTVGVLWVATLHIHLNTHSFIRYENLVFSPSFGAHFIASTRKPRTK